ncbi:ABC transporter ATP-binding protein [Roseomonas alkaliterrae]|uniref:Nitrate/nitrite transport system ATP-binding protein n=1 Tax=Neoroseomonas alkaliterrae TaxID=1452450 RepID=A0A840XQ21_9PROT|nr:ABC transporter ATP-binding protein [Neoroseomonas alkaliterrae]MBB5690665.1 nitrate/nitrite transport system ATP-binding protein [Neoroseomonas alkaliterrae]MBR0676306.1 ABC transporter ATP-binding protein [Neoroseomonas alkaliterrae]
MNATAASPPRAVDAEAQAGRPAARARHAYVSVEGIARRYGATTIFEDVWFGIERGEFVCLVGHSGCGKTTILNILAGLEGPTEGAVIVDGAEITGPSLDRAVIFQGHALMPWMTATGNVAFALSCRHRGWSRAQCEAAAREALKRVGLGHALDRRPAELSGGMKQRVGIARALALEPKMMLMDEPFSALDALTRGSLQDEVSRLVTETRQTAFMITHDVDEAILLADRILLMSNGPGARIAEVVVNTLPRPRTRANLHHMPGYHALRDHVLDFLISRSAAFDAAAPPAGWAPRAVPEVRPAIESPPPPLAAE